MTMPDSVRDQLAKVFDTKQAVVLANVVTEAHDTFATKSDMQELRAVVRDIAEFQKAADARQAKTDARIDRMAESIDQLTGKTEQLTVGQERLTTHVQQLTVGQERLTTQVQQLTVGQERLFASQERLTDQMQQLTVRQDQMYASQERLTIRQDQLHASQERLTGQMQQLTVGQERLFASEERLTEKMRQLAIGQDDLVGPVYEGKVAAHLYAYVGDVVNRCVVLDSQRKADFFEELATPGDLTRDELSDLRRADIFATGRLDGEPVVLVVEVSRTGDEDDIDRTARRAAILAKTGRRAIPIVACLRIDEEGIELARERGAWVIRRGRLFNAET